MPNKFALLGLALLSTSALYAIPVENRGLSDAVVVVNNGTNPIAGNSNWDLIQKNQQLENQIRELRGKIEEQDYAIEQLIKEVKNNYDDLDQRLELLNQKLEPDTEETENTEEQSAEAPVADQTAQ